MCRRRLASPKSLRIRYADVERQVEIALIRVRQRGCMLRHTRMLCDNLIAAALRRDRINGPVVATAGRIHRIA